MLSTIRISVNLMSNPKVQGVRNGSFRLYIASICYAGMHLTDGVIDDALLRNLDGYTPRRERELIKARLWEKADKAMKVHDFLQWNDSKADVERDRLFSRNRMRKYRERLRSYAVSDASVTPLVTQLNGTCTSTSTYGNDVLSGTSVPAIERSVVPRDSKSARGKTRAGHAQHAFCGEHFCVSHIQHEKLSRELGAASATVDLLTLYPVWDQLPEPIDNLLPWLKAKIAVLLPRKNKIALGLEGWEKEQ